MYGVDSQMLSKESICCIGQNRISFVQRRNSLHKISVFINNRSVKTADLHIEVCNLFTCTLNFEVLEHYIMVGQYSLGFITDVMLQVRVLKEFKFRYKSVVDYIVPLDDGSG